MGPASRHQCLLYESAPSQHLPTLAVVMRRKIQQNHRCLYLNSVPMVAGMQSYLAAAGLDVATEIAKGSLVLTSEQGHLVDGHFDIDRMMGTLGDALSQALLDGYAGLWATGDMTWEMGPDKDFSKLMQYEWRLEEFLQMHCEMGGICQYHAKAMPKEALRTGLVSHKSLFINETLSLVNPYYVEKDTFTDAVRGLELDSAALRLCQSGSL